MYLVYVRIIFTNISIVFCMFTSGFSHWTWWFSHWKWWFSHWKWWFSHWKWWFSHWTLDFPIENCDFPIENGDFPIENGDFPIENGDFPWFSIHHQSQPPAEPLGPRHVLPWRPHGRRVVARKGRGPGRAPRARARAVLGIDGFRWSVPLCYSLVY